MNATKDWIYNTNIYEVNLRQYTKEGTFKAFAGHLPRLKEMGVQTLWFMPVTPIAQKNKKGTLGSYYACSDYTATNPEFGTLEEFKTLVRQAHEMEFKVIIDWVANHTGWDHVWTKEHPDWFEKEANGEFKRASGMDDIIELDYRNKDMRKAMIKAMKFWVEQCDIDGFRCDLAFWVELDFWLEAIPHLNKVKPLFWLAEADSLDHPDYMQVFDAAYSWTWMHKTEEWFKKKLPLKALTNVLDRYENAPGLKAWFTSNHDENTWNGSEYEKYGDAAKVLAVHSCTWPGIPLVYSGQELPNKKRLEFFDKDVIEWTENFELHEFYRTLLTLQHNHPALHANSELFQLHTSCDANVLAYLRKKEEQEVIVILNLSNHLVRFDILDKWLQGKFREAFLHHENDFSMNRSFEMKAWEWLVYVKQS
jgi:alpha-amylase